MGDLLLISRFYFLSLSKSHFFNNVSKQGCYYLFFAHVPNEVTVQEAQTQTIATFSRLSSSTPTTSHDGENKNDREGDLVKLLPHMAEKIKMIARGRTYMTKE